MATRKNANQTQRDANKRVFICHSSEDRNLAIQLSGLIGVSLNLAPEVFRFTSLADGSLSLGLNLDETLRNDIASVDAFIAILSRSALKSTYVLCEFGARWGLSKPMFPIICPDVTPGDLNAPISGLTWITVSSAEQLEVLIYQIGTCLGITPCQRDAYETSVKAILDVAGTYSPLSVDGITTPEVINKAKTRLRGEVFAIELLTKPVTLERKDHGTLITIDRTDVKQIVISNKGKERIFRDHVLGKEEHLKEADLEIHRFLAGSDVDKSRTRMNVPEPLRWASGGVLSVVTFRNRNWVPLFFRDIRPYGWNIALGSTERLFDANHRLHPNFRLEMQLNNPSRSISREFLEESIVLNGDPRRTRDLMFKKFLRAPPFDLQDLADSPRQHCDLRSAKDNLNICASRNDQWLRTEWVATTTKVEVRSASSNSPEPTTNVLACFSLLDLGIEVVEVAKYELGDDDYMVDGEVMIADDRTCELVRMPIALFSCDYLRTMFADNDEWFKYTFGPAPSITVKRRPLATNDPVQGDPASDEVHLFTWDVERRMAIVQGEKASEWERNRFSTWYDMFGHQFLDSQGRPTCACLPQLFVPATAKLLNLYFTKLETRP